MLSSITIDGYRSVRHFSIKLAPGVTAFTGPNGCGKTNIYSALRLLQAAAGGELARRIALEGGLTEVLWAGKWKVTERPRVSLTAEFGTHAYHLEFGSAGIPGERGLTFENLREMFPYDPQVKRERVWAGAVARPATMVCERESHHARLRGHVGEMESHPAMLDDAESVLAQIREPDLYPELDMLARTMLDWRFCHEFRTDANAPIRERQLGTRTPVLAEDGHDLVSALMTIDALGNRDTLAAALERVLPGWRFERADDARVWISYEPPLLNRRFGLQAASDGMLRYLCLVAVLLSPRPPALLVLNEPETSLHPDLLEPLAELIGLAGLAGQVLVTTHSRELATMIGNQTGSQSYPLRMEKGMTRIDQAEQQNAPEYHNDQ